MAAPKKQIKSNKENAQKSIGQNPIREWNKKKMLKYAKRTQFIVLVSPTLRYMEFFAGNGQK